MVASAVLRNGRPRMSVVSLSAMSSTTKSTEKKTTASEPEETEPTTTAAPDPTETLPTETETPEETTTTAPPETTPKATTKAPEESTTEKKTTEAPRDNGSSPLRDAIVAEAMTYVGWLPYVWGGTSLETGADCSGFVQSIYKKFGIKLPRSSDDQGNAGKAVSSGDMRPGDIVHYEGHVAIYIGDGLVVHASGTSSVPNTKVSTWNYRTVLGIRNVLGD